MTIIARLDLTYMMYIVATYLINIYSPVLYFVIVQLS